MKIVFCNFLKILFWLFIPSQFVASQTKSEVGLELGIAFSQFKTRNVISQYGETITTTIKPVISPLIAISKNWTLTKQLEFVTGLEYQMAGKRSYTYTNYAATTSYMKEWVTLKMHKICLPVTFGYLFNLGKFHPFLFIGVRPNLVLHGSLNSKFHETLVLPGGYENTIDDRYKQNIYDKNEYYIPPKRIFNQLRLGFSTLISQSIKITFNYNIGHNYYKNIYVSRGNYSTYTWTEKTSIPGSDYVISLKYILNIKKKAPKTDDKKITTLITYDK